MGEELSLELGCTGFGWSQHGLWPNRWDRQEGFSAANVKVKLVAEAPPHLLLDVNLLVEVF